MKKIIEWFKYFFSNKNQCSRVGYDLYECSCKKCIELDILRESYKDE